MSLHNLFPLTDTRLSMKRILPFLLFTAPIFLFAQQPRPNILFIMSDDHAAQALSCYGSQINQTPNLDRIAQNGMRFDRAYCTNSICAPARAAILTGKLSHRNGMLDNLGSFDGSQPTAPKMLREAGYQTAMVGKWHLKSEPTGFDFWKILDGQGPYYNPDFLTAGGRESAKGYTTTLITDIALDWLQEQRDSSKPFFMMLQHKAPHRNWMPEPKYLDLFKNLQIPEPASLFDDYRSRSAAALEQEMRIDEHMDLVYDLKVWDAKAGTPWFREQTDAFLHSLSAEQRDALVQAYAEENEKFLRDSLSGAELIRWKYQRYIKDYLRCIQSVDDQVGRVLDYLEQSGLSQNTLVIYTSDQGFYLGEHGWFDKRFIYEESYRQPLMMQWPGAIPPGSTSEALVMNVDFAPTFLHVAGDTLDHDFQGVSLLPLFFTGQEPLGWRDATYYHYYEYPAVHAVKRHYGLRTQRYKLAHFYFDIDAWEMYDLERDPQELNNVYENPAYLNVRSNLMRRLDELQKFYGESPETYLAPLQADTVQNLARRARYTLLSPPEQCHSRDTARFLVDGMYRRFSAYNAVYLEGYAGFQENPLEAILDFGEPRAIREAGIHCRQTGPSWIHYPTRVEILISEDGKTFQSVAEMDIPEEAADGSQWITADGLGIITRYLKIKAVPKKEIPAGLPGAGKKAWLFVDELFVG